MTAGHAMPRRHVTIVGAGVIGLVAAHYLQDRGHDVRVIDPRGPAGGASRGHAGGIAVTWVSPQGLPGTARRAPRWLLDPVGPVAIRPGHLLRLLPWLARLQLESRRERVEEIADALQSLTHGAYEEWKSPLEAIGQLDQIEHTGALTVYRSSTEREHDEVAWELRRQRGYDVEDVDAAGIRELEPALSPSYTSGVLETSNKFARDPLGIVEGLAEALVGRGGQLLAECVGAIHHDRGRVTAVTTDHSEHDVDVLVIAAGAWSGQLTAMLGDPVPLESERGYSTTLPTPDIDVRRVISIAAHKMTVTPMTAGLRLAGTAEFAGLGSTPNWRRAEALLNHGRAALPGLTTARATRWAGDRPILPDSLPVLGRATHHDNVVYAFGHSHIGFTLAGVTGRIVADIVDSRDPGIDLTSFRSDRFWFPLAVRSHVGT